MGRLDNQVIIVTGGGHGFGAGIARRLDSEGASVIIADMSDKTAESVIADLKNASHFVKMDVSKEADWKRLISEAESKFGGITCVVNNAGTSHPNKASDLVSDDEFDRCFNVNVKSVFYSAKLILPRWKDGGVKGSFINIASVGATRPRPGLTWYNASKAAVHNATKSLAAEYGPHGIRVNSICPLLSGTGLFQTFTGVEDTPENRSKFLGNVPMGRLCEPSDVAAAVSFLASPDAAFITGTNLEVDGGRSI